jgi:coenzyme PQQ precursor peptide PqqA
MEWEKPGYVEISLSCEIGSYAIAELSDTPAHAESGTGSVNE